MGLLFGLLVAFIVGAAMVEMGITAPDFELPSRIFAIVCGIICMLPGILMAPRIVADLKKKRDKRKEKGNKGLYRFIKLMKKEPITQEDTRREESIRAFKEAYGDFFRIDYPVENSDLQNEATQLHWNILALQRRRLDKKKIRMEFDSMRMKYGEYPAYTEGSDFDGKYYITEVSETMEAKKSFYKDGRKIGSDKCSRLAHFVMLDPKTTGKGLIICPNCGGAATRENLLDGCDYCNTKFNVEDLEERVSDFSFGQDYDLAYALYQDARSRFSLCVALIVGIPTGIFSLIGASGAIFDGTDGSGPLMRITGVILSVAFVTFAAVLLALIFFYFFAFPIIQVVASVLHITGKSLDVLKKAKLNDQKIEEMIRKDDPLFSRNGFYSHLQNMLATIFMGETNDEILAFSEGESAEKTLMEQKDSFKDIINVSTNWMRLVSYEISEGMSKIVVEGNFTLTKAESGRIKRKKRQINMCVIRDAECVTKAVTGPSFTKCTGCGNSLSILSGKKCEYCGRVRKISSIDWVLGNFEITARK